MVIFGQTWTQYRGMGSHSCQCINQTPRYFYLFLLFLEILNFNHLQKWKVASMQNMWFHLVQFLHNNSKSNLLYNPISHFSLANYHRYIRLCIYAKMMLCILPRRIYLISNRNLEIVAHSMHLNPHAYNKKILIYKESPGARRAFSASLRASSSWPSLKFTYARCFRTS